jgi:ABC-type cobalamin transport system ATPase subunit
MTQEGNWLRNFTNGSLLQIHPSISTLHAKLITKAQPRGSLKLASSSAGNRRVLSHFYGFMENVHFFCLQ